MDQKWFPVVITFSDNNVHYDEVLATNEDEAVTVAYWNWEDAVNVEVKES